MAKITALDVADALTGDEHLPIVQGQDTKRTTMAAFRALITPYLQYWYKGDRGDTGAAASTYVTKAELTAAPITHRSYIFAPESGSDDGLLAGTFTFQVGDYSTSEQYDEIAQGFIVALDGVPLTMGALVRADARSLSFLGRLTRSIRRRIDAKLGDIVSVKDFGAVGDGVTDDTAAIQAAIDATRNGGSLTFPEGRYLVTTLHTGRCETHWFFHKAELVGGATVPTDCVLKFGGVHTRLYGVKINCNFNPNYSCGLWWYNAGEASQHNDIYGLDIHYAKVGIIYGEMPGEISTYYAQSENNIFGYRPRGVEVPIIVNHENGFINLYGAHLVAHAEEWAQLGPPDGFDSSVNRCFEAMAGHLMIYGGELQNTIDPLGVAARVSGGVVHIYGVIAELSVPVEVKAGYLLIHGGRTLNTQSLTPGFTVPIDAATSARVTIVDHKMERNPGTGSFSAQPLIANAGAPPIEFQIINSKIDDWAQLALDSQQRIILRGTRWMPNGLDSADVYHLDTESPDLLDRREIDRKGYTTEGHYPFISYGSGGYGQSADVPTGAFASSIFTAIANGEGGFATAGPFTAGPDGPSSKAPALADLKAKADRVGPGDRFLVEAWLRNVSAADALLALFLYDIAGTEVEAIPVASAAPGGWRYVRGAVKITAPTAVYASVGMLVKQGEGRFCPAQLRRADWGRR
ncbi:glycosyl hydrolase family 28-related protein [Sphingomonas melonis]|uniref:glycosyl hydrolase family 28-related protein n=1 Tax=Sphingomonas melonis TaxID=152682 RepID=UPI0003687C0F|nr:glycosyl hydrolase family 28-related protein [Sphingomonas melonis]